jgi:phage terminase large subunit-like protein|tara:strand:- start:206 stop:448 length:243 start_codon:yes stop_codon:yes gene_type:complete
MSHELSVTFQDKKGKWIVAPSVFEGRDKPLSEDSVAKLYEQGKIKALGKFESLSDADKFAKKRSKIGHGSIMRRAKIAGD